MSEVANNTQATEKKLGGCTGKGFMPGQSGNPTGRPKKGALSELYERLLADPEVMVEVEASIRKMISSGRMVGQLQLKEMADRVEGKVTQPIDADLNINLGVADRMQRAKERLGE